MTAPTGTHVCERGRAGRRVRLPNPGTDTLLIPGISLGVETVSPNTLLNDLERPGECQARTRSLSLDPPFLLGNLSHFLYKEF